MHVERPGRVPGQVPRITELWVWCAYDPMTDTEGIVAMKSRDGGGLPMVVATKVLAERLQPIAEAAVAVAEEPRPELKLRRFVPAEEDA